MTTRQAVERIVGRPIADEDYIALLERAVEAKDGVILSLRDTLRDIEDKAHPDCPCGAIAHYALRAADSQGDAE